MVIVGDGFSLSSCKKDKIAFSQIRTDDLLITSEVPYHLAIKASAENFESALWDLTGDVSLLLQKWL